ncbi:hypothetical protein DEO72_LG8g2073 [Vigna unguiculata]|uniref:Uncharacterized protein n=1 Tax=Vigna unguiculata TaxID=3917 RepID=A0A4D6MR90_VIGUN|nr:hypothetical protein DEO72_LG8g2073 [Vigna unguiculata]
MAATAPPPPSLHHAVNAFTAPEVARPPRSSMAAPTPTIVRCPPHVVTAASPHRHSSENLNLRRRNRTNAHSRQQPWKGGRGSAFTSSVALGLVVAFAPVVARRDVDKLEQQTPSSVTKKTQRLHHYEPTRTSTVTDHEPACVTNQSSCSNSHGKWPLQRAFKHPPSCLRRRRKGSHHSRSRHQVVALLEKSKRVKP